MSGVLKSRVQDIRTDSISDKAFEQVRVHLSYPSVEVSSRVTPSATASGPKCLFSHNGRTLTQACNSLWVSIGYAFKGGCGPVLAQT